MENSNLEREVRITKSDIDNLLSSLTQEIEEKEEIIEDLKERIGSFERLIDQLNEEIEELRNTEL